MTFLQRLLFISLDRDMIVFGAGVAFCVTMDKDLAETGWETCLNLGYRSPWVSAAIFTFFCRSVLSAGGRGHAQ